MFPKNKDVNYEHKIREPKRNEHNNFDTEAYRYH